MTTMDNGQHPAAMATLAGGCFWCLEAVYEQLDGVQRVVSGYAGGHVANPTYEQVCMGTTGHAEVTQITYDPAVVSYDDLLNIFFSIHDPTTLNRQGYDMGPQYRSAVFFHDDDQKEAAEKVIADLTGKVIWRDPIVTEIVPLEIFYPGEEYHQQYFRRNPEASYCQVIIQPKVAKFREQYLSRLRA